MFNHVMLIGRIGKIENRTTATGKPIVNLSVATDRNQKDATGQWVTHTEWHNCVAFANQADYLSKGFEPGQVIRLDGELRTREFDDKNSVKRRVTEIMVNRVQKLPSYWKQDVSQAVSAAPQGAQNAQSDPQAVGDYYTY